jgi:hypothetical protein
MSQEEIDKQHQAHEQDMQYYTREETFDQVAQDISRQDQEDRTKRQEQEQEAVAFANRHEQDQAQDNNGRPATQEEIASFLFNSEQFREDINDFRKTVLDEFKDTPEGQQVSQNLDKLESASQELESKIKSGEIQPTKQQLENVEKRQADVKAVMAEIKAMSHEQQRVALPRLDETIIKAHHAMTLCTRLPEAREDQANAQVMGQALDQKDVAGVLAGIDKLNNKPKTDER